MDGMGYSIWRLQDFKKASHKVFRQPEIIWWMYLWSTYFSRCYFHLDILNISSSQSVSTGVHTNRSKLSQQHFWETSVWSFSSTTKKGEFLKNLSPFPDPSPKNPWFPTRCAPNNSEIIWVPISPPCNRRSETAALPSRTRVPEVWYMRCGHEKFNLSSTDPLNVVTNTKALALLENHGRLAKPIPTCDFLGTPGVGCEISWGLYTTQLYWYILLGYLHLADVDLYFLCTKHKV